MEPLVPLGPWPRGAPVILGPWPRGAPGHLVTDHRVNVRVYEEQKYFDMKIWL